MFEKMSIPNLEFISAYLMYTKIESSYIWNKLNTGQKQITAVMKMCSILLSIYAIYI